MPDRSMLPTLAGAANVEGYRASNCRASSDNCSPSIRNSSGSSASIYACGVSVGFILSEPTMFQFGLDGMICVLRDWMNDIWSVEFIPHSFAQCGEAVENSRFDRAERALEHFSDLRN